MSAQVPVERLKKTLLLFIDETFSNVQGMYLDKGTTLYETLDGVTAAEASRAAGPKSGTIAAQVEHGRFYLDVLDKIINTKNIERKNNWREKGKTGRKVRPEQWEDLKKR